MRQPNENKVTYKARYKLYFATTEIKLFSGDKNLGKVRVPYISEVSLKGHSAKFLTSPENA